jgi:hypothetical protein
MRRRLAIGFTGRKHELAAIAKLAKLAKLGKSSEITRFKGLGEISPDEFGFMIGPDMRLDHVEYEEGKGVTVAAVCNRHALPGEWTMEKGFETPFTGKGFP